MTRTVVLVGLMGAGKTVVGSRLARRLGFRFTDLDAEVERRAGVPIPDIFRTKGERTFRRLEAEVTHSVDVSDPTVIAAGGGWMARPELRDCWPDAVRVWLEVSPEMASERLAAERPGRPLLAGSDVLRRLKSLLAARLPSYALAEYRVATDGRGPDEVVDEILQLLVGRSRGGAA